MPPACAARTGRRSITSKCSALRPEPDLHSRSFVLCPGLAYDRSPCGTGTSAKLACLAADGKLQPGEVWRQESVIGTTFDASFTVDENRRDGVLPHITGAAYITDEATLIFDDCRPVVLGHRPARVMLRAAPMTKHVLIVGGGIIGLSVAYYCARKGHRVTLIERGGSNRDGCSFVNAGMVVPSHVVPLASPGMVQLGLQVDVESREPVLRQAALERRPSRAGAGSSIGRQRRLTSIARRPFCAIFTLRAAIATGNGQRSGTTISI